MTLMTELGTQPDCFSRCNRVVREDGKSTCRNGGKEVGAASHPRIRSGGTRSEYESLIPFDLPVEAPSGYIGQTSARPAEQEPYTYDATSH